MKKVNKRLLFITCVLGMAMLMLAGCGSKSPQSTGGQSDEQQEVLAMLQEAAEQYAAEPLRGTVEELTVAYTDGNSDTQKDYITIDTDKKIVQLKTVMNDESGYTFYTKEGDKNYMYTSSQSYDEQGIKVTGVTFDKQVDNEGYGYDGYSKAIEFTPEDNEYFDYLVSAKQMSLFFLHFNV